MIEIKNVSKWYGPVQVLNDCSVSIAKGDRIAQAFVLRVPRVEFVPLAHEDDAGSRGGFGSTGVG